MKMYWGLGVRLHSSLTSAQDGGEWSVSQSLGETPMPFGMKETMRFLDLVNTSCLTYASENYITFSLIWNVIKVIILKIKNKNRATVEIVYCP
jgi:hypothetical protein